MAPKRGLSSPVEGMTHPLLTWGRTLIEGGVGLDQPTIELAVVLPSKVLCEELTEASPMHADGDES